MIQSKLATTIHGMIEHLVFDGLGRGGLGSMTWDQVAAYWYARDILAHAYESSVVRVGMPTVSVGGVIIDESGKLVFDASCNASSDIRRGLKYAAGGIE